MANLVPIVEGHGEVQALPVLLRRIADWLSPGSYLRIEQPIRVAKDRFLNRELEFARYLQLAASKCKPDGRIFLLLDADGQCPAASAADLHQRISSVISHRPVSVVFANTEFEAWFIAAAPSLSGSRGFLFDSSVPPADVENIRDAKGWISARMSSGNYGEVLDQPAFAAILDIAAAHEGSRSFRKLCSELQKHPAVSGTQYDN
jgi:hypothetical protein